MASTPEERAMRAIPHLRARLEDLRSLSAESVGGVRFAQDDHFAFMALFFHARQLEHSTAVLTLADHPDSSLVARTMMEGLWQLTWAAQDRAARAEQWRAFAVVYDWRILKDKIASGSPEVTDERRQKIESRLAAVHDRFLTNKARRRAASGAALPDDPYPNTWTGITARELAEATGALELYAGPYDSFSERQHWSPASIGFGIRQDGVKLSYSGVTPTTEATVLSVAFQCLIETSLLVSDHLKTGFDDRLMSIQERYMKEHEERAAND